MRIVPFLFSGVITTGLLIVLGRSLGDAPPLGELLSPQTGFWQNAEPADKNYSVNIQSSWLKDSVSVYLDERLVPHVFAKEDDDLYFVQGYLHAKFRLWQMEMQTYLASGRLTEILGAGPDNAYLNSDRNMRRVGMVYSAMNSLQAIENDPVSKACLDAYTEGINAYISNLPKRELPLEYRLLNYTPEKWTNLKTALFLKYMSYELTSYETDIENTNAKSVLSKEDFDKLYPLTQDSIFPIVRKGTVFPPATVKPQAPASVDSLYLQFGNGGATNIVPLEKPDKNNGSNNWAVSGIKTRSGRPILCSDPHLGLNLPSLWYEMQLSTPRYNAYGVTFPGAPAVIIGFNDSCAWGMTNSSRDVKDYYAIRFKDDSRQEYWFNGEWKKADMHIETFKLKNGTIVKDTVAYTVFGPVQYDASFNGNGRAKNYTNLAVKWKAHEGSNELKAFYLLNRVNNYNEYVTAIKEFDCPGQNFVFASKNNEIAIWQQGKFPARWKRQGDFIMPGTDSSYMWQYDIPQPENPHVHDTIAPASWTASSSSSAANETRVSDEKASPGFVCSANQVPTDSTYPYYLSGHYDVYRGFIINRYLRNMNDVTPGDMEKLQTDNYNVFAEKAVPVLLDNVNKAALNNEERRYLEILRNWNYRNDPEEKAPGIFVLWVDSLAEEVWGDEMATMPKPVMMPDEPLTIQLLKHDTANRFIDNINTPQKETVSDVVTAAFKKIIPMLSKADADHRLPWAKLKDSGIRHLLRQEALSRFHLPIGGGAHIINAASKFHGPSWRMVVHLTDKTEAYGIYPGGQSGNPGSRYYDNFVDDWAVGKYNTLWVMTPAETKDAKVKYTMRFSR